MIKGILLALGFFIIAGVERFIGVSQAVLVSEYNGDLDKLKVDMEEQDEDFMIKVALINILNIASRVIRIIFGALLIYLY